MEPIPHPPSDFLLGNVRMIDPSAPIKSFTDIAKDYGPIFQLDMMQQHPIFVCSQELADEVCDDKRFSKKIGRALNQVRDFAGDGLFTAHSTEPNWAIAHRILMPAFGPKAIQDMFGQMYDIAEQMCVKWERLGGTHVIDIVDNTTRLTLDTLALCAFHYRFNSFYNTDMHPFVTAMSEALAESRSKAHKFKIVDWLMMNTNRIYRENIELMHTIADDLIRERREKPQEINDLLNRMILGVDPISGQSLSDNNIRYQMVTFLIAGHETTSGLLSFALHELVKNPDVLRRAQQEVDDVIGTETINIKHLPKLVYLDQVLKETLRLWPTAPAFSLECHKEEVIGGKYLIKPDDTVFVLLPALHRDPKVWGDDADKFNPDRVSPEKFAALPKNSWKPFGNAARACIGRPFAWQEALLVLGMILQRFDIIDHDPQYELIVKETLTMKPDGLFMRMNTRSSWKNRKQSASNIEHSETAAHETSSPQHSNVDSKCGPLLVLFGSNSGTCESFAHRLYEDAQSRGYEAKIAHLNAYSGHLPLETPVVIVTASYEGLPTDDAKQFVTWLEQIPGSTLKGVKYAVFGCGHTDWRDTYQRIPTFIDSKLEETGATRLVSRGESNAAQDMFYDFESWRKKLWSELNPASVSEEEPKDSLKVDVIRGVRDTLLRLQNLRSGEILENRELVTSPHILGEVSRSKRHIEVRLPDGMKYREGDYLAVLPVNSMNTVNKVLRQFNLSHDDQVLLQKNRLSQTQVAIPTDVPISVVDLLLNYFELSQPASKHQILTLVNHTDVEQDKMKILDFVGLDKMQTPSVLDILNEFKTCKLTLAEFLEISTPMRVRQYSISSSPLWSGDKCTITVGVLSAPTQHGGMYEGVASNFLAHCLPGMKVSMMVRSSSFKLPADSSKPMIMISAGTGIAPFRGFIQQRAALQQNDQVLGEALLFHGCRDPDQDFLYKEELEQWSQKGVVQLRPVFSRIENTNGVKYVQHRLWECRDEVGALLLKEAHIFVCGEGDHMAPDVKKVLIDIYKEVTSCTQEEAERRMSSMDNRYSVDVFA